ncbi:hypothetical protein BDW02DRAFT_582414 [Decorospora gaudefroyi]|uniref:Uncharacterized protein n=1 Tax=Decorospora gaudefroyi TaxID=184978 RepID=A0A6A5K0D3_9PLEO|nr:hypothetical protein BDW02DRAFT_582414 [Decorospora gaudefroyi]
MGLLSDAIGEGSTKTVAINKSDWTVFYSPDHPKPIEVRGPSACSVFAIVSPYAAVVAHIGPNIMGSTSPTSFIELAEDLTNKTVRTCVDNPQLFPLESKTYVVCATLNNDVSTASEQLRVIYRGARSLPHASVQWHYERSTEALINNETHLETLFIDGRSGLPRFYLEDRDITDVPESVPTWRVAVENGKMRYQLTISHVVIESQDNPPLKQWILNGQKWIMWDGQKWASQ